MYPAKMQSFRYPPTATSAAPSATAPGWPGTQPFPVTVALPLGHPSAKAPGVALGCPRDAAPLGAAGSPPRGAPAAGPESPFQRQQHLQIPLQGQSQSPCRKCPVGGDGSLHPGWHLCPALAPGQPWHCPAPLQDRDTAQGPGASTATAWTRGRAGAGGPITTHLQLCLLDTHRPQAKQTANTCSKCSINYAAQRAAAPHALLDLPGSSARILPLHHSTGWAPATRPWPSAPLSRCLNN